MIDQDKLLYQIRARPESEWHEDNGEVLWWSFPITEPPYVGSPLCFDWPGTHTHWTPIVIPQQPNESDALLKIVNALCITLTRHFPNDQTIKTIAEGANQLYAKNVGKNDRPR